MNWAWFERLSKRERLLAVLVGGTVFLLINYLLWDGLLSAADRTRADLAVRNSERNIQKVFMQERDPWSKREAWLKKNQPVVRNAGESSAVLDDIKQVASKHNIVLENPQLVTGEKNANYQALGASFETKTPWPPLVRFLYDLQQPGKFLVFENLNLSIDGADNTQMRGKFKVTRWFAPAGTVSNAK